MTCAEEELMVGKAEVNDEFVCERRNAGDRRNCVESFGVQVQVSERSGRCETAAETRGGKDRLGAYVSGQETKIKALRSP